MMSIQDDAIALAQQARTASYSLVHLTADQRTHLVSSLADGIESRHDSIIAANRTDLENAENNKTSAAFIDRLRLTDKRFASLLENLRAVAQQEDLLGTCDRELVHPNGMQIKRVRVPLGSALVIFESRPNVAADAAALCMKSGNAVILRGGSEAHKTNSAIVDAMNSSLATIDYAPPHAIQLVENQDRAFVTHLLHCNDYIDVVIPRGGESLIRAVDAEARMPVIKHFKGICHTFVDEQADEEMALSIVTNAKCQRPGVCNALETLLIHEARSATFLPKLHEAMEQNNVELRADSRALPFLPSATSAAETDWDTEYLDLILSVKVVADLDAAIEHIHTHGSRHSECIVTDNPEAATRFLERVDAAAVYHNASTRFTDGAEFGLGAEIGISTDKLHARGPMGVEGLTTYKYCIHGSGQIRG